MKLEQVGLLWVHFIKTAYLTLVLLRGVVPTPNGFLPSAQNRTAKG